jgi:protein SCO1/2
MNQAVPARISSLPLRTDTGKATSLAAYHGKIVLLTDFLTLCSDACPLVSQELADIDRTLLASHLQNRVELVELTVDPQRDTPARLLAYRKLFDAPANWAMLTGPKSSTDAIWHYFGVYFQRGAPDEPGETDWWTGKPVTYDIDHADDLIFIDASGHERFLFDGLPDVKGQQLPKAMANYLDATGRAHLAHPRRDAWTTGQALSIVSWLTGMKLSARE